MGQLRTVNKRQRRAAINRQARLDREVIHIVDRADIPGGGQLVLLRSGEDFSIRFRGQELMGNRDYESEQALATLTSRRLASRDGSVLVGGLGMGFTLGAVLANWSPAATVVVAELVPQLVAWAKGPLAHLFGPNLDDPRVSLRIADVHDVIVGAKEEFDAILLDVDNGPDGLIQPENERLYCNWGLRAAHAALRAGGVLAIWSAYPDPDFVDRLELAGFFVEEVCVPAFPGSLEDSHSLWFAAKAQSG